MVLVYFASIRGDYFTQDFYIDTTFETVSQNLTTLTHIPEDRFRFWYGGREIERSKTLTYYNILDESTIFIVFRTQGEGGREPRKHIFFHFSLIKIVTQPIFN